MINGISWIWFILAVLCSALPIFLVREYILTHNIKWLICSVILCILLNLCYIKIFNNSNYLSIFTLCKIITIMLVAIIGLFIFNIKTSLKFWVAIILFITAALLID